MESIKKNYKPLPGGGKGGKKVAVAVGKKPPTPFKPLPVKKKRGK